jgi:hypothetical protein
MTCASFPSTRRFARVVLPNSGLRPEGKNGQWLSQQSPPSLCQRRQCPFWGALLAVPVISEASVPACCAA